MQNLLLAKRAMIGSSMKRRRHYRGGFRVAGQKALARAVRKKQTTAETRLWQLLRNRQVLGAKFRRQHQFGNYILDFYCHEAKLVIECDGAVPESNERWHHDQERDSFMISQGLTVLRFANDQVLSDTASVMKEISRALIQGSIVSMNQ